MLNLVDFPVVYPGASIDQVLPLTVDDPADALKPAAQRHQLPLTPAQFTQLQTVTTGMTLTVSGQDGKPVLTLSMALGQLGFTVSDDGRYVLRVQAASSATVGLPSRLTYHLLFTQARPGNPLGDFVFPFCGGAFPVGDGLGSP